VTPCPSPRVSLESQKKKDLLVQTELFAGAVATSAAGPASGGYPDGHDGRLRDGARADYLCQVGWRRWTAQCCICRK